MLLIGIDEAGYGPRLGPLCHGYSAIRCPDVAGQGDDPPDLWKLLKPTVRRCPPKSKSFVVDDSKKVYCGGQGLELLTHSVGAFLDCAAPAENVPLYCRLLPEHDRVRLAEDRWGGGLGGEYAAPPPVAITAAADAQPKKKSKPLVLPELELLRAALSKAGCSVLACGARAMSARYYNQALASSGNKADVNWSVIAEQLQALLNLAQPGENVCVVIDRQGGRKFYAAKINALFADSFAWVEKESPRTSIYKLETARGVVRIAFVVEADGETLAVALGSMAAKLAREMCMARLNAYFRAHAPDVKATAGYYGDASRFLNETLAVRQQQGIANDVFVRVK